MEKTTVYLTAVQKAALGRIAVAEGRSEAGLIRAGIDDVIAGHRTGEASAILAVDERMPPTGETPIERPRWIDREAFIAHVVRHRADAGLRAELHDLAPDTTDDEPLR